MKIKDLCSYAPKSRIKAGEAVENAEYLFFTSSADENKRYTDFQFDKEAIIMGTGGNATLHYYDGKFSVSTDCLVLLPNSKIKCKYLYYFFKSHMSVLEAGFKGAGLKHTNKKYIEEINVSEVPDLTTQEKIISHLDTISENIEKLNRELELFDSLTKARFVELFGDRYINDKTWPSRKLGDCISFNNGKAHEQVVDENGEYILVTSRAIASDFLDVRRTNALLFPLHKNDIVMVMSDVPNGRALAKCQLIDEDEKYTLNQRICSFDNYDYNPIFLLYLLNRHQYFLDFDDGNSQTNLRKNDILRCNLINPPMELQDRFAEFVKQVDKLKLAVQQSLEKTQLLFDSLMQEYFGEN